jgi:hypothetical protein
MADRLTGWAMDRRGVDRLGYGRVGSGRRDRSGHDAAMPQPVAGRVELWDGWSIELPSGCMSERILAATPFDHEPVSTAAIQAVRCGTVMQLAGTHALRHVRAARVLRLRALRHDPPPQRTTRLPAAAPGGAGGDGSLPTAFTTSQSTRAVPSFPLTVSPGVRRSSTSRPPHWPSPTGYGVARRPNGRTLPTRPRSAGFERARRLRSGNTGSSCPGNREPANTATTGSPRGPMPRDAIPERSGSKYGRGAISQTAWR